MTLTNSVAGGRGLLDGDPGDLASRHLQRIEPIACPGADIDDSGVIMSRFDAVIGAETTVRDLNNALGAEGVQIVTSRPGSSNVTLGFSRAANLADLEARRGRLIASKAFEVVITAQTTGDPSAVDETTPYDADDVRARFERLRTLANGVEGGCRVDADCHLEEFRSPCEHFVVVEGPAAKNSPAYVDALRAASEAAKTMRDNSDCADGLPKDLLKGCRRVDGANRCIAFDPRNQEPLGAWSSYAQQVFGYLPPLDQEFSLKAEVGARDRVSSPGEPDYRTFSAYRDKAQRIFDQETNKIADCLSTTHMNTLRVTAVWRLPSKEIEVRSGHRRSAEREISCVRVIVERLQIVKKIRPPSPMRVEMRATLSRKVRIPVFGPAQP